MESARFKLTLKPEHPVNAYALMIGGIFPLFLAHADVLLIDRNILRVLHTVSGKGSRQDAEANKWWLSQLNRPDYKLNPVLCATESGYRSTPTFEQFCASFDEACAQIKQYLPRAQIIPFEKKAYDAAYKTIIDVALRHEREQNFLIAVSPLLATPTAKSKLEHTESLIFGRCKQFGLNVFSLPCIAALSCLYEERTGKSLQIGRKLIKPSANYGKKHAHNTLSDLRALEYLALANGLGLGRLALCTRDKALAAFWCALKFEPGEWSGETANIKLKFDQQLFPALSSKEMNGLYQRMVAYASKI